MGNDETKIDPPTPEELKAEEEARQESKEEEVRAAVIEDYGFDDEADTEKIDKLVKERMGGHEKLSAAIGQKIKYREALAKGHKPPEPKEKDDKDTGKKDVSTEVQKALEQRDLDDMELPDEIKTEIKRIAEIQGVSIKKAAKDPYIVAKIDDHKKAQKADDASISNKNNKGGGKKNWSVDAPPDVDMSTPEGRKTYEEWRQWAIGQGA